MNTRWIVMGGALVWLSLAVGCVSDAPDSGPVAMRSEWVKGKPQSFNYTLTRLCYCRDEYVGPFQVLADKDQVLHATRMTDSGKVAVPVEQLQGLSIDSVLADLDAKLHSGYHTVSDSTDGDFGYPARIELDQNADTYDDEFGIAIDGFRVADPLP